MASHALPDPSPRAGRSGDERAPETAPQAPATPAGDAALDRAVTVLAGTYLFRDLSEDRLRSYAGRFRRRRYPRGAFVCREGDPSDAIYVLASGTVKGSRLAADGDETVDVVLWRPGEIFGEPGAVIDDAPRVLDGVAVEPTECLVLGRDDLLELLEADPVLMRRMLSRLATMTRERAARIADVAFLDVTGRVARTLLELAASSGHPDDGAIRIELPMSQRTLAGMVVASRESVNRSLAILIADGAISQRSGSIAIHRQDLLRRRARLSEGGEV